MLFKLVKDVKILSVNFILFFLMLVGCIDQSYVEEKSDSGKLSEDNVFKEYETVLDKAKGVEQTIQDTAKARKREMDE